MNILLEGRGVVLRGVVVCAAILVLRVAGAGQAVPTAEAVLAGLKEGNAHHAEHKYKHPHETSERMKELAGGQHPEAEVLSCADSRVPPELLFDRGLGDLFVVRVAGNIAGDTEIASLEYGAEHLHIPLLVVLGHESCGAVTAAVEGGEPEGHLSSLIDRIKPAVDKTKSVPGDRVHNAVEENVRMVVDRLRTTTPILSELVKKGKLKIVGGVYSLETGKVRWLKD
ncbi:MAG TPA: carbonic anhydrase [Pyrinomonadaceae bacterium]|nr:carbonic anhydrase [Pyrinomonadaceae bacterium]